VLIVVALGLLVFGKAQTPVVAQVRANLSDVATPLLEALSHPIRLARALGEEASHLFFLYRENERLREDNRRLLKWQAIARRLEQDNRHYQALLKVTPEGAKPVVTARVIGEFGGSFARSILLNAGTRDGVRKGQPAFSGDGVVGRVVGVGRLSSRVLLLTDLNSRVPVSVEARGYHAILAGDNTDYPRLTFLPVAAVVEPGQRVVTSGIGGVFPPGLPVGKVVSVFRDKVRVKLMSDLDRLEYIRLFAVPGVAATARAVP